MLLCSGTSGLTHTLYGTIGSCAQGTCGRATINSSATNPYDIAWANTVGPADLAASNTNLEVSSAPSLGTPLSLPCYPSNPPTYFGSDMALHGAAWQSSTSGNATAFLPVSGKANPQPPGDCSLTGSGSGWWMVDLQQSLNVQAVLVQVGAQMSWVQLRVGDNLNASANAACTAATNTTLNAGSGAIFLCDKVTLQASAAAGMRELGCPWRGGGEHRGSGWPSAAGHHEAALRHSFGALVCQLPLSVGAR